MSDTRGFSVRKYPSGGSGDSEPHLHRVGAFSPSRHRRRGKQVIRHGQVGARSGRLPGIHVELGQRLMAALMSLSPGGTPAKSWIRWSFLSGVRRPD